LFQASDHQSFPPRVWKDSAKIKSNAESVVKTLSVGKVIVNLQGAVVHCMIADPLSSGGLLIRALCIAHTEHNVTLDQSKFTSKHWTRSERVQTSPLRNALQYISPIPVYTRTSSTIRTPWWWRSTTSLPWPYNKEIQHC